MIAMPVLSNVIQRYRLDYTAKESYLKVFCDLLCLDNLGRANSTVHMQDYENSGAIPTGLSFIRPSPPWSHVIYHGSVANPNKSY